MDLEPTIAQLAPRLIRYCTGCAGNRALGEEAAQEALAALVQRWRRHGAPDSPEAFAFRIAQRRTRRALFLRRLTRPLADADDRSDTAADPAARTLERDRLAQVRRAVARLPRHERDALLLVSVSDLNSRDAAALLGISASALKMRVHRARTKLRGMLELEDDVRRENYART